MEQLTIERKGKHYKILHPYHKLLFILLGIFLIALYLILYEDNANAMINTSYYSKVTTTERNETLAQSLEREVRVLCWVMTTPANHKTKALHVARTWGKRCNRLIFVTSAEDNELSDTIVLPIEDTYGNLWGKTREAFRRIYQDYYNEADWFLKADDDTFIFMENLRYLLYAYSPEMPIYFGHKLTSKSKPNLIYMSGGSGYVLSSEALRRFAVIALHEDSTKCRTDSDNDAEDAAMGACLQNVGVIAGVSRDASNKIRFSPFEPYGVLISHLYNKTLWYFHNSFYHNRHCHDCLSKYPISFHYVSPPSMDYYEIFNYEFDVFGLNDDDDELEERLPEKLLMENIYIPPSDNSREN